MAAVTVCSDFGTPKNSLSLFRVFPHLFALKWWDQMPMILVFWMLSFKPVFSLSSFTFIKRLFGSSSLSAIRVVHIWGYWCRCICICRCAYLRLLVFLPAILIPACASSSPAFRMMYSAYKLNKQGDNTQPWRTPFPVWNQSVPSPILTVASWPASQEAGQVVWYSCLSTTVCGDPHSQRLWRSCESRNRCFSGSLSLFRSSSGCWQFDLWFLCLF